MQVDRVKRDSKAPASGIGVLFGLNAFSSSDSPHSATNRAPPIIADSKPAPSRQHQPQPAQTPQLAARGTVQEKWARKEIKTPDAASMGLAVLFGCQPKSASLPQTAAVIKAAHVPVNGGEQNSVAGCPLEDTQLESSDSENTFAGQDTAHCDKNTSRPFVLNALLMEWLDDSGLNTTPVKEAFCKERIDCELLAHITHDQLQDLGVKKVFRCFSFTSTIQMIKENTD